MTGKHTICQTPRWLMEKKVTLSCRVCAKPASTVQVVPFPPMIASQVVVRCAGRRKEYRFDTNSGLLAAIENQDARALYQLNPEYAQFYCPDCDQSYCSEHWKKRDESGRLDASCLALQDKTYGFCPAGHERQWDESRFGCCPMCGTPLAPDVTLYWDTHCPSCADKSLDDWSEDAENL
jgi:NAD-dependent SIR2 family protein deacetylase